ncbi:MAG: hypothetical protein H6817_00325 [Phycisphaerales bacterium]|nr:hypothetical protein [Phycisphaerales bacterium]
MQRVRFVVPRLATYASDAAVELYGDLGSGAIDFDHPLPPGRVRLWPVAAGGGHLAVGHLVARHLDAVDIDGHLAGGHLGANHLDPVEAVVVESPRYVFGRFRHALRMFDGVGNVSTDTPVVFSHTVNSAPRAPGDLHRVGYDAESGVMTFSFARVRFGAVAGA